MAGKFIFCYFSVWIYIFYVFRSPIIAWIRSFFISIIIKQHLNVANLRFLFIFASILFAHTPTHLELITKIILEESNYMFICMHLMILSGFNYQSDQRACLTTIERFCHFPLGNWILMVSWDSVNTLYCF